MSGTNLAHHGFGARSQEMEFLLGFCQLLVYFFCVEGEGVLFCVYQGVGVVFLYDGG